ncbi:hypothetical protein [Burkholderia sp. BE17]|uniref:hypothetical protein n=1 Tax=Burkholderia sp. BE17 TaxID=2656644 RepID=UPI001D123DC4|nr:hypothetical protein [Burkholderia sp. BE17]
MVAIVASGGGGSSDCTNAITARARAALDAAQQALQMAIADAGMREHGRDGVIAIAESEE